MMTVRRWVSIALVVILLGVGLITCGVRQNRSRQAGAEADALFAALQLTPTSIVADVGAGSGRYTLALARRLEAGHVFATEIDPSKLDAIRRAVDQAGITNITTVQSRTDGTGLESACCDGVFLRTVYHHITEPEPFAAALFGAVKPGGRLAIIDFEPGGWLSAFSPVSGVPTDRGGHGVPQDVVVAELTGAGFTLEEQIEDWGARNYGIVFIRPPR